MALSLPAASPALTANVWPPSARLVYVAGLVHGPKPLTSSLQLKLAPVSLAEKLKLALLEAVSAGGPESIVAKGAVRSTRQERLAGVLSRPPASRAMTSKLWVPSARPL